jgi:hypothetical protein
LAEDAAAICERDGTRDQFRKEEAVESGIA